MSELCSQCAFFIFDEEYDEYICDAIIDEDDFNDESHGVLATSDCLCSDLLDCL